ncbi:hypothetical protein, partial [Staphylococcus aureus]|uniref:hypothetical protein n=1 Tax=Staphylococcus aureus TaxID=1280 RepID=UPI00210866C7
HKTLVGHPTIYSLNNIFFIESIIVLLCKNVAYRSLIFSSTSNIRSKPAQIIKLVQFMHEKSINDWHEWIEHNLIL